MTYSQIKPTYYFEIIFLIWCLKAWLDGKFMWTFNVFVMMFCKFFLDYINYNFMQIFFFDFFTTSDTSFG